jgi:hypothetical protein
LYNDHMDNSQLAKILPDADLNAIRNFRDTLDEKDRTYFDEMLINIGSYLPAAKLADGLPLEKLLLIIVMEQHKAIQRLLKKTELL